MGWAAQDTCTRGRHTGRQLAAWGTLHLWYPWPISILYACASSHTSRTQYGLGLFMSGVSRPHTHAIMHAHLQCCCQSAIATEFLVPSAQVGTIVCPLQALYRGNGANVLRLVPEVAFKHMLHDQFKIMFSPPDGGPLGVQQKAAAAASTGNGWKSG